MLSYKHRNIQAVISSTTRGFTRSFLCECATQTTASQSLMLGQPVATLTVASLHDLTSGKCLLTINCTCRTKRTSQERKHHYHSFAWRMRHFLYEKTKKSHEALWWKTALTTADELQLSSISGQALHRKCFRYCCCTLAHPSTPYDLCT